MTDTFFDLQRFAADAVLVGGQSSFTWQDGETFGPTGVSVAVGTQALPAFLLATGGASEAGTGTDVYLNSGTKSYSFSLNGKDGWDLKLSSDGTAHVTNSDGTLALSDLDDAAAVLNVKGTFEETVSGNSAYIKTASDTKVTLNTRSLGLVEQFGKNVSDIDVVLYDNAQGNAVTAEFAKGASNIDIGVSKDDLSQGFGFDKAVTVGANALNQIVISSDKNNTVTVAGGDVWKVKKGESTPTIFYGTTNDAVDAVVDIKGATLESANGLTSSVAVAGTVWNSITGGISSIAFDSVGAATVEATGAVVVSGQAGANASVKDLTSATLNGIKVSAAATEDASLTTVAFALEDAGDVAGISSINVSKALNQVLTVNKDVAFDVVAGKATYGVVTDANALSFAANASQINVNVEKDKSYTVDGNAGFTFADNATAVSINGAAVSVKTTSGVTASAADPANGIDALGGINAGDKVSVSGDADGFNAIFNAIDTDGEVTFEVNNASIKAAGVNGQTVGISINGAGTDALITGLASTENVSVGGTGITYHFKDETSDNAIPSAGEAVYVTLDSTGAVADSMDDLNYKKLKENDQGKWDNVASVGNDQYLPDENGDTVAANRSEVYEQFYNLGTFEAGQATVAVFANEDDTTFDTVANPNGVTFTGRNSSLPLAENGHITLTAGSNVGAAPINIQRNESDEVVDVVVDLRSATLPSTVAVGTLDSVTASHAIYLSNAGTGYVNVGALATGQNKIFAGTGGAQIRHDGERATIVGNSGIDTIWAGKYDIVRGGAGGDQFYDSADYTITDYDATAGDALIATRLHGVDQITKANIKFDYDAGNEVSFGTSRNSFTLGQDQNASLNLNVAIMDTDARVVGSRSVVLAGRNGGAVDASALTEGALIIADGDRNSISGDAVTGTAYADEIYIGNNDIVNPGAGNDYITIGSLSTSGGAIVAIGAGKNTVSGWNFGFDANAGATELIAAEGYIGSFDNDRLLVTDANGSMLFDDSAKTSYHGEYNVIVNGKKYMAIRTNNTNNTNPESYGIVESNADLADTYIAEREGILLFTSGVTENLGTIDLTSTNFQNITKLTVYNNNKAVVLGSDNRETVALGGYASVGASKYVDLGAGNDVIYSGGDGSVSAGHVLFFGDADGRDTIRSFSHYLGIDVDPDHQYADTLVLDDYEGLYTGTAEDGGTRIEFLTSGDNRVFLYEDNGISTDNIYQIQVNLETKLTKIGNSNGSNVFAYSDKVDYYVGSSAENAADTLTIGNEIANANVWLDGSKGDEADFRDEYYRGIAVVDAGAETNTTVTLVGNSRNNTLIAGGEGTYNALWGGSGNNELIGSTAGQDTFFYVQSAGAHLHGYDEDETAFGGNDQVYNYEIDNGDLVWLGDTKLSDITKTTIEDNSVTVEFSTGGSLTVHGTSDVRFAVDGGTLSYVANKESKTWTQE